MTEEYHTSEFQNLNYKPQRRLFDVLPIRQSHDTIRFLAPGGLHEDKLCVTLQEAMTPANVEGFMKPRSTQIVFVDAQPASPAPKRSKHAPIIFSRPHINTKVYDGGLKLTQLACEPASTFPKALSFLPKGPKSLCSRLVIFVSRQGFTTPPIMMPSPLKTVWVVDSTGSTPPSTSGIPLTGHSTTELLTVSSLPQEATRAERKVPA